MASVYQDKQPNSTAGSTGTSLGKSLTTSTSGNNTAAKASAGTGSSNISKYAKQISSNMQTVPQFQASDSLTGAQNYLKTVIDSKPGSYVSKYTGQLDQMYSDLMARGKYTYDMNGDALYNQYRQRYMQAGKSSMMDTIGNQAGQTGGYASSAAQSAGQAAFNQYMQQLQQAVPELQQQALQRYNDETSRMTDRYNLVNSADQTAYSRNRDQISDWQNERSYAAEEAQRQYSNEYGRYQNDLNQATTMAGWEREDAANDKSQAQTEVNTWLSAGIMPSRKMVEAAGMDYDQVKKLHKKK